MAAIFRNIPCSRNLVLLIGGFHKWGYPTMVGLWGKAGKPYKNGWWLGLPPISGNLQLKAREIIWFSLVFSTHGCPQKKQRSSCPVLRCSCVWSCGYGEIPLMTNDCKHVANMLQYSTSHPLEDLLRASLFWLISSQKNKCWSTTIQLWFSLWIVGTLQF